LLLSPEVDQHRGFIRESDHSKTLGRGRQASFVIAARFFFASHEPVSCQLFQKCHDLVTGLSGYVLAIPAQGREHVIYRTFSVKELPHVHAGGAQAKTPTGVGVEEDGPIVKLLPE
jgi:hypothetical protein